MAARLYVHSRGQVGGRRVGLSSPSPFSPSRPADILPAHPVGTEEWGGEGRLGPILPNWPPLNTTHRQAAGLPDSEAPRYDIQYG